MSVLETLNQLGGVVGGAAAAIGFVYAGRQLHQGNKTSRAQFLMDFNERLAEHWDTALALNVGGKWTHGGGPRSAEDWARIESYMGLFEILNALHDDGLFEDKHLKSFYAWRLQKIWDNESIRKNKMELGETGWSGFIALSNKLEVGYPSKYAGLPSTDPPISA